MDLNGVLVHVPVSSFKTLAKLGPPRANPFFLIREISTRVNFWYFMILGCKPPICLRECIVKGVKTQSGIMTLSGRNRFYGT